MAKRVRLTDDSLNCYGTRVLTAGLDISQYEKNPVLLYMHERGIVIGYLENIEKSNTEVTAELVFDEATELSKQCKIQWDKGSLRMVSVGIDIIDLSEDPSVLVHGQTRPTITRSKLCEVSLVDIGANDNAIVLKREGITITLAEGGDNPLPLLNKQKKEMDTQKLALLLGLDASTGEQEIQENIMQLMRTEEKLSQIQAKFGELQNKMVTMSVDNAIAQKKITADTKEHFVNLGMQIGIDALEATFAGIPTMTMAKKTDSVMNHINHTPGDSEKDKATLAAEWDALDKADKLYSLKKEDPEKYQRLFEARFKNVNK